jgi:8-oxo-dGTP pyrophosphatase MutT (NUDIX family)
MTHKHPTSSVFVFCQAPEGWRLGLIKHPRLGRMMIPGGHVEQEESPAEAALREVAEETGLNVRMVSPPAAPLPGGYRPRLVAQPWWIVEYAVPPDGHHGADHVHIDHLYVSVADGAEPVTEPAHPFGWYAAADLAGLYMFEDARALAHRLLSGLSGLADGTGLAGGAEPAGSTTSADRAEPADRTGSADSTEPAVGAEPGPALQAALLTGLSGP